MFLLTLYACYYFQLIVSLWNLYLNFSMLAHDSRCVYIFCNRRGFMYWKRTNMAMLRIFQVILEEEN